MNAQSHGSVRISIAILGAALALAAMGAGCASGDRSTDASASRGHEAAGITDGLAPNIGALQRHVSGAGAGRPLSPPPPAA